MKSNIIYNYISSYVFNKNNINYKEYQFNTNIQYTFSIGVHEKKIKIGRNKYKYIKIYPDVNNINEGMKENYTKATVYDYFSRSFLDYTSDITPLHKVENYITKHFLLEDTKDKIYEMFYEIQNKYFTLYYTLA